MLSLNGYDTGHYPFKCKCKGSAYAFGTANGDGLLMRFEDMLYDGESKSGATYLSRSALVGPVKAFK